MSTLEVSISQDVEKRLNRIAKLTGRTKLAYVKEAILEHLADIEDYYLTEERAAKENPKERVDLLDVMKEYGLAH